jgi:hypothetical protein
MLKVTKTQSNGRTSEIEYPETCTIILRGGQEFNREWQELHDEGERKLRYYGYGRYLRDGAPASVEVSPDAVDADPKELKKLEGVSYGKNDAEELVYSVTSKGISALNKLGTEGAKALATLADEGMNAAALAHAEARYSALVTGEITSGRMTTSPEVPILRKYVTGALVKALGLKVSKVPKLPGTQAELRSMFTGYEGLSPPDAFKTLDAWFDKFVELADAEVKRAKETREALGI